MTDSEIGAPPVVESASAGVVGVDLDRMGRDARSAAAGLAGLDTPGRTAAVAGLAEALERGADDVLTANHADLAEGREKGLTPALLDRLTLDESRLAGLAAALRSIASLPDPVGRDLEDRYLPSGLRLIRRAVPLGVVGAIYEARPNVTLDIAALCLKTGNACLLRGGSETLRTNVALMGTVRAALEASGLPPASVQLIADPDRRHVEGLLRLDEHVDMIVPRGGSGLHRLCRERSTIPVMTGGIGVCHLFVDESADLSRVVDVVENAKVQRPTVCNALDTLLIHRTVAPEVLPAVFERLTSHGVEFVAEPEGLDILSTAGANGGIRPAADDDFDTEWLRLTLGIRIVADLGEAVEHIRRHSTRHSDGILTGNPAHAERFIAEVDSAAVYVNASTRFTDGGEFGLGAEVAVSTQKLHARGPMGLEALTTYKWIALGEYHVRP